LYKINDRNNIHDNIIKDVNGFGINLQSLGGDPVGGSENIIYANTIINSGLKNVTRIHSGILVEKGLNNIVSKNYIYGSGAYGIYSLSSNYNNISDNIRNNVLNHQLS
jgi:parallel beta-helix repeat protein